MSLYDDFLKSQASPESFTLEGTMYRSNAQGSHVAVHSVPEPAPTVTDYGECIGCDCYVLVESEAPYCSACTREREAKP